jgi:hypothetical protein
MTLSFTFKVKDAWIIVADKKAISYAEMETNEKNHFFSDNTEKIKEINNHLFFVGAGNQEILDKAIEAINSFSNLKEFKDNLDIVISQFSDFNFMINLEEFLIIDQINQKAIKCKLKNFLLKKADGFEEVNTSSDKNFIGCYEMCNNLGNVKIKFSSMRKIKFKSIGNKVYDFCNWCLSLLSVDYLKEIGHPAIHGSDIWIISKEKVKKISTLPKNVYEYEVIKDD